jgi:hypothetical protein
MSDSYLVIRHISHRKHTSSGIRARLPNKCALKAQTRKPVHGFLRIRERQDVEGGYQPRKTSYRSLSRHRDCTLTVTDATRRLDRLSRPFAFAPTKGTFDSGSVLVFTQALRLFRTNCPHSCASPKLMFCACYRLAPVAFEGLEHRADDNFRETLKLGASNTFVTR